LIDSGVKPVHRGLFFKPRLRLCLTVKNSQSGFCTGYISSIKHNQILRLPARTGLLDFGTEPGTILSFQHL
jgi:hypothetical protein